MTMEPPDVLGYSPERRPDGRSNIAGPARIVTVLLLGCCVTGAASGLHGLRRERVLGDLRSHGGSSSADYLQGAISPLQTAEIAGVLVTGATSIVFVVWFWRLIKNAQLIERTTMPNRAAAFAPRPTAPAAGWAIGAWLVPIANLFLPAHFMIRVDRISGPSDRPARALVIWWAITFAISNTALRVLWRNDAQTLAELQSQDRQGSWLAFASIAAAVLAILVVRALTDRQLRALDAVRA